MPFAVLQAAASRSFVDDLANMLYRYVTATAPFAFAHLLLVYNVIVASRRIGREIRALNSWPEGAGLKADSAAALTRFIEECSTWGSRGILVPMTDFSDRLDASVTGFVDHLHSRMNLFLVVGVAGTFFALFSALTQPNVDVHTVTTALPNALPVGFVGLVLSLAGHYLAFKIEHSFREAVSRSTQRAIAKRMELSRSPGDAIRDALEQLSNVLQKSLEPVLKRLEGKIEDATRVTTQQVQPLSHAIGGFSAVIAELKSPLELMRLSVDQLPAALSRLEDIESAVERTVTGTAVAMGTVESRLTAAAGSLAELAGRIGALPDMLTNVVGRKLDDLAQGTAEVWTRHTERVLADIRPASECISGSAEALRKAAASIIEANSTLQGAAGNMVTSFRIANDDLVSSCGATWTSAVGQMAAEGCSVYRGLEKTSTVLLNSANEASARLGEQTKELAAKCYFAWRDTGEAFARETAASLAAQLSAIQESARSANDRLRDSADRIDRIGQSIAATLQQSLRDLHLQAIQQLKPELKTLREAVAQDYPAVLEALAQSVADSRRLAHDFGTITEAVNAAAGHLQTMDQKLSETNQKLRDVRVTLDDGLLRTELGRLGQDMRALTAAMQRRWISLDWMKRVWPFGGLRRKKK
jgi:hypothetical protein